MKPLLAKTTKPFLIYVLIILAVSIPVYYWVVDSIWISELDEHNKIIAEKSAYELNQLNLPDEELEKSVALWNTIQPGTDIEKIPFNAPKKDVFFTVEKKKPYTSEPESERFRCLKTVVYIKNQAYLFSVETNVEESHETVMVIAFTTLFFFIVIVIGLLILNRRLSNTVWKPFHNTLNRLKSFDLSSGERIGFEKTDIKEFEELNQALSKLIDHNISVYKTQKEFTENASHELQTPLAILQNKLDVLIQDENMTKQQYQIIEDLNKTLARSSRINKNLLLLAKIENQQFAGNEKLPVSEIITQYAAVFEEHFEQKNISVQQEIENGIEISGNRTLTETLVSNLLVNAVRHTEAGGNVHIKLSETSLEISNSGTAELNKNSLFKRFSRSSTDSLGSGLGLAIIKEICVRHNWDISYDFKNNFHIFRIIF